MITIHLKGGLGNQLFQIFVTIAYALEHGQIYVFPYSDKLGTGIVRPTYWHTFLHKLLVYTTANNSYLYMNKEINNLPIIRENGFHYQPLPAIDKRVDFALDGYYQSYRYFEKFQEKIYEIIGLVALQKHVRKEFQYYLENAYTVSMHFRLGDYKYKQEYHPVMPKEYYKRSLRYILSNAARPIRVLYFCEAEDNGYVNEIIECLKNAFQDYSIEFVKVDDTIEDWKQLLLMSCCNSQIIANSTYSWFGAYLCQDDKKHVCYPNTWFGPAMGDKNLSDLFPQTWTKINF
jgi:hypothetical protein